MHFSHTHTHTHTHSLLQFVKGAGNFASEMADAVLNSLTAGRHEKFMDKYHAWEEKERLGKLKKDKEKEGGEEKGEEGEKEGEEKELDREKEEGEGEGGEKEEVEREKEEEEVVEKEKAAGAEADTIDDKVTGSGDVGTVAYGEECSEGGGEEGGMGGEGGEGEIGEEEAETACEDQEEGMERDNWFVGEVTGEEMGGSGEAREEEEEGRESGVQSLSLSRENSAPSSSSTERDPSSSGGEEEEEESPEETKSEVNQRHITPRAVETTLGMTQWIL